MIGLGSDNNGGYFGGDREGKESYIIIVGVWPLNVLRDILLLGSSHQHHCKHHCATIIFQSSPTFVKEGGIEEAGNEGGGMGETPVGRERNHFSHPMTS